MIAVSCVKASLVILFFMHLKYESGAWKYVLTIPAAMMSLFLVLALVPDVMLRGRMASPERLQHMAVPQVTHAVEAHAVEAHSDDGAAADSEEAAH
jgi:cytochrome c oxidase subunit 4